MKREDKWYLGYLLLYFAANLAFLCDFPFVHSDEAWLSGLTRNMMERARQHDPGNPRLPALTSYYYNLLKKYGIHS